MYINELSPVEGSTHVAKRKGRGHATGNGKTAGRGHKGQKARSGGGVRIGFEGGQMPLARRIPKRGFNNIFAKPLEAVNVSVLNKFEDGAVVDAQALLDAGSAVAGCGGAFACLFLEGLADGGVLCGLPRDKARRMAAQMLLGSAKLALESGDHTGQMKDAICSPGGTTIAGIHALENHGVRGAFYDAVMAVLARSQELQGK